MATSKSSGQANQLAGLAHILGIITSFVAPLIIWLSNSSRDTQVDSNAKEALNFQITVLLAHIANGILTFVLFFIWPFIAWAVTLGIWAVSIWWAFLGFQAANKGERYRYPFAFRIVA
jgi:uncharacterized Tic20 family protein